MKYNAIYDENGHTFLSAGWGVGIKDDKSRGWMEYDGETMGGLWFEDMVLTDYDGVFDIPKQVVALLKAHGYDCSGVEGDETTKPNCL